ncbi:MAG: leucine-rich repeat protein [Eubacteriales bacterium]|nr:leucine-rich repeat protein [Eubacteriales bacterium]
MNRFSRLRSIGLSICLLFAVVAPVFHFQSLIFAEEFNSSDSVAVELDEAQTADLPSTSLPTPSKTESHVDESLNSRSDEDLLDEFSLDSTNLRSARLGSERSAETIDASGDFVIDGNTVYGLTKAGVERLKANGGVLSLPTTSPSGTALTRIGSFAFAVNKLVKIEDYTGRPGVNGVVDSNDIDGFPIYSVGESFPNNLIRSLTVPEGYSYIGQDAFEGNSFLTELTLANSISYMSDYAFGHTGISHLTLPSSLTTLGDHAFFDSQISGTLDIPASVKDLGEGTFKGNQISNLTFAPGSQLHVFKELVFQDNKIELLSIPDSVENISEQAFADNLISTLTISETSHLRAIQTNAFASNQLKSLMIPDGLEQVSGAAFASNPGVPNYPGKVALNTYSGTAPSFPEAGPSYVVNPVDPGDESESEDDIDYTTWDEVDFLYDGPAITGFSPRGEKKIVQNKNLELPSMHDGVVITKIADDAFRNVDLASSSLKKYDIESVQLPSNLEWIGDFAFQSNQIAELMPDFDMPLKHIGAGAFMNNQISDLSLPSTVEYIGDAAFHINKIGVALIPKSVTYLGRSAFRQNTLEYLVGFEEGAVLKEIGEMAFAESNLTYADLANATMLETIGVQAFAGGQLGTIALPNSVKAIKEQAFASNQFTSLELGDQISEIAFNAFDANPGLAAYDNKVLINTASKAATLKDGDNFVINPSDLAENRSEIEAKIAELKSIDAESLRPETAALIQTLIDEGEALLKKEDLSKTAAGKFLFEADFFLDRLVLDRAIKRADEAIAAGPVDADHAALLADRLSYAKEHFNNAAWDEQRLARIIKELTNLRDLAMKEGPLSEAKMIQGVHHLESPLPIPAYYIGLNVYFDKDGTILFAYDRSYSIGAGQNDEYGNPIENVDEDNEGYHVLAIATLDDYEGRKAADIVASDVDSVGGIRAVPEATYHRAGVYAAILDAAKDYLKQPEESETTTSGSESSSSTSSSTSPTTPSTNVSTQETTSRETQPSQSSIHRLNDPSQTVSAKRVPVPMTGEALPFVMVSGVSVIALVLLAAKRRFLKNS